MGKKYIESSKLTDKNASYTLAEALELVIKTAKAKSDKTIELHVRLGVDPRHVDRQVRGTVILPHGTGKDVKALVFVRGEKAKEVEAAGAGFVGADELIQKIQDENRLDYDAVVVTPDIMDVVGRSGRVLGPKGLMLNPKLGAVTFDAANAIGEIKAGKAEYRVDKTVIVHYPIGKKSFGTEKLIENFKALMDALIKAKPAVARGQYLESVSVSATMGPRAKVNPAKVLDQF